jgi:hypothetical protein
MNGHAKCYITLWLMLGIDVTCVHYEMLTWCLGTLTLDLLTKGMKTPLRLPKLGLEFMTFMNSRARRVKRQKKWKI